MPGPDGPLGRIRRQNNASAPRTLFAGDLRRGADARLRAAQRGRIEHLRVVSGEARKFTGLRAVSHFDREIGAARRCFAGIYWTHRHLYRGRLRDELKAASAEHCRHRFKARTGILAKTVVGFRLELGLDLVGWWTVNAAGRRRVAA